MPVTVGVLRESAANESRVAIVPEIAAKLKALGARVLVERGAGMAAHFTDSAYKDAELTRRRHDSRGRGRIAVRAAAGPRAPSLRSKREP